MRAALSAVQVCMQEFASQLGGSQGLDRCITNVEKLMASLRCNLRQLLVRSECATIECMTPDTASLNQSSASLPHCFQKPFHFLGSCTDVDR